MAGQSSCAGAASFPGCCEMGLRGFRHSSPIRPKVEGELGRIELIVSVEEQRRILLAKSCDCLRRKAREP
jgi:hypothetical protein